MGEITKQGIKGTAVTYLGVVIGFITTFFVMTRLLTAEEIGLSRVMIDAAMLLASLSQLGTNASIVRFYPYFKEEKRTDGEYTTDEHGFFFWTIIIPMVGFVLFSGIFLAAAGPIKAWFGEKSALFVSYYYFVLPMAFFYLYQSVMETNATVRQHIVLPRAVRELGVRVGLLTIYLLYAYRVISMDGLVIALCLNFGICALINTVYLFRIGDISLSPDTDFLRQHPDLIRKYARYTGFLIISALAGVLAPTISSFFVTAEMGLNYAGIFAIATYMAALVSIPSRSLIAIASPSLSAAIKDGNQESIQRLQKQVANNLMLIGAVILMAMWMNIDLIFHILPNGATYAMAKNVVLILGVGQIFVTTFSISTNTLNYSRWYAWSLLLSLVLTCGGIVLNNYLIPILGIEGAAWAMMLSETIYYLLVVLVVGLTTKTTPICTGLWKTTLLLVAMVAANTLWLHFIPMGIWAGSIARTMVIGGSGLAAAYYWQISPEIKQLTDKFIR